MIKVGKLFVCDRCGNTGFTEYNGPANRCGEIDIYNNRYEKLEGWEIWDGKNLCPDCAKEYHMRLKGFWKEETK